ncbi:MULTISPECIES: hypothetical protein [Vibrio]|nr:MULTISPECIES: hypothetical protein [Vibrio]EHH73011.1 hypothetical protein VCHC06A1_1394 [Vibrio cholerae HC-06A1]EHH99995.1 hypothetical protein VCHC43A1_1120 [Vibrio cholerae HC-43A1]EHI02091.1 hypothetical protein VCHC33A2_1092 [Vibrio cholerae HC-33A2]EJH31120.1 hypothetical protein VCCP104114_1841 [Vibrio cholerae CP1041(14)]EJH40544.1 hypothetical protein VCCP104215_2059 [Vibrio cholerae CP1042(15)]EJH47466.1 hypothetical protein VCCP104821_1049 [Vibrio cholerae CP1048(21)]EKG52946.
MMQKSSQHDTGMTVPKQLACRKTALNESLSTLSLLFIEQLIAAI